MLHQTRFANPLRTVLLSAAGAAVLLLAGPAIAAHAAWDDSAPLGSSTITTGSLGIDPTVISGGTWKNGDAEFSPSTDKLAPGTTLTYTVRDVSITAVGNNLQASFAATVAGAGIPTEVGDHLTISLASAPTTILGADSSPQTGKQTVDLVLTVTAGDDLPNGQEIDLTGLTVSLTNTYGGWTDTATLDAGTLTTGAAPAGGTVALNFNLALDKDRSVCFYLTRPRATIYWNDYTGGGGEYTTTAVEGANCHLYPAAQGNQAYVTVSGTFAGLGSPDQSVGDIGGLIGVNLWTDDIGSTSAAYAFYNAVNMTYINGMPSTVRDMSYAFANASTATTTLLSVNGVNATAVRTMAHMFDGAGSIDWYSIQYWDTSNVTDMSYMFRNAATLNEGSEISANVSGWDTGSVTTMRSMFEGASAFDSSLAAWDTSNVEDMSSMFRGAATFNQNINNWETSKVTDMSAMFEGAAAFNQNLDEWDTANVEDMSSMFQSATTFQGDIRQWDVRKVKTMSHMFDGATNYTYFSLGDTNDDDMWDVDNVEDMSYMFANSDYNKTLKDWNVSSVTTMEGMFENATSFNQPLGPWDTSSVTTMKRMFAGATAFNQDLSGWTVTQDPNHDEFNDGADATWVGNPSWQPQWPGSRALTEPSPAATAPTPEPTQTPSGSPTATPDPSPTTPSPTTPPDEGTTPAPEPDAPATDDAATKEDDDTTPATDAPTEPATEDDPAPGPEPTSSAAPDPTETAREEGTD